VKHFFSDRVLQSSSVGPRVWPSANRRRRCRPGVSLHPSSVFFPPVRVGNTLFSFFSLRLRGSHPQKEALFPNRILWLVETSTILHSDLPSSACLAFLFFAGVLAQRSDGPLVASVGAVSDKSFLKQDTNGILAAGQEGRFPFRLDFSRERLAEVSVPPLFNTHRTRHMKRSKTFPVGLHPIPLLYPVPVYRFLGEFLFTPTCAPT